MLPTGFEEIGHPERKAIGPESRSPRLRSATLGQNGSQIELQTRPLRKSEHLRIDGERLHEHWGSRTASQRRTTPRSELPGTRGGIALSESRSAPAKSRFALTASGVIGAEMAVLRSRPRRRSRRAGG
jgi:hypothetical protein